MASNTALDNAETTVTPVTQVTQSSLLLSKLQDLIKLIPNTQENKLVIDNVISQITAYTKKVDDYEYNTIYTKEKSLLVFALIKFIRSITTLTPIVYGSFVRQMFEKSFMSIYDDTGYGNSQNHDIDISVYVNEVQYNNNYYREKFNFLIELLSKLTNNNKFNFNGFILTSINNNTITKEETKYTCHCGSIYCSIRHNRYNKNMGKFVNVPHYHLIFSKKVNDKDINILVDLFSYKISNQDGYNIDGDLDVNKIELTDDCIRTSHITNIDVIDIIENIINKKVVCNVKFNDIIEKIKTTALVFEEKKTLYNYITMFLVNRLKVLNSGYEKIYGKHSMIKFSIETEETCIITDLEPPYLLVHLECGHKMSLMAIAGSTNIKASNTSEGINCPYCRQKLIPQLDNELSPTTIFPSYNEVQEAIYKKNKDTETDIIIPSFNPRENKLFSQDNIKYIISLMGIDNSINDNTENNENNDTNITINNFNFAINNENTINNVVQILTPPDTPIIETELNIDQEENQEVNIMNDSINNITVDIVNNMLDIVDTIDNIANIDDLQLLALQTVILESYSDIQQ